LGVASDEGGDQHRSRENEFGQSFYILVSFFFSGGPSAAAAFTTSLFIRFGPAFRPWHRKPEIISYNFFQESIFDVAT
jgi:hypothetical protein